MLKKYKTKKGEKEYIVRFSPMEISVIASSYEEAEKEAIKIVKHKEDFLEITGIIER